MAEHESSNAVENRVFAHGILARIEANTGIKLQALLESDLSPGERHKQVRALIIDWVETRSAAEKPSAEWALAGQKIDASVAIFGANVTNIVPNVALTEQKYRMVQGLQGHQIDQFLKNVTDRLSLLKPTMRPGEAAATIAGTALASFGVAMIWGTFAALVAGKAFMVALTAGVAAMGSMTVVVGAALLIVAELLLFFLVLNKKVFLGMVFNNTDMSLRVGNWRAGVGGGRGSGLFMNTGSMTTFMETHETPRLDSPLVQVGPRLFVRQGDPDNLVWGGIFCAEKNVGFYGTEGVILLSPLQYDGLIYAFLFACPYVLDNGVNVAITGSFPADAAFNMLYGSRGLERRARGPGGFFMTAKAGDTRGGEACGFATIDSQSS
jgi:hypothetical protein